VAGAAYGAVVGGMGGSAVFGAQLGAGQAWASMCWVCIVAVLVIAIVMALVACDPNELKLQMRLGAGICHWVGSFCKTKDFIGDCLTRGQDYCCFNGKLPLIIQEQGRPQIGKSWGTPGASPDCSGFTITELSQIDFSKIDFSAFIKTITPLSIPSAQGLNSKMLKTLNNFFATNPNTPTSTNGVVTPVGVAPYTPLTTGTQAGADPLPPMAACNISLVKNPTNADGSVTGTFTIDSCNPLANLIVEYKGTCPDIPTYTNLASIPSSDILALDTSGATSFSRTVPASCLVQGSPAINNSWAILVNDRTAGLIGTIKTQW
jgi:hypothetical protein